MAYGKKQITVAFDQSNVAILAAEALAKARANRVHLAMRFTGLTPLLMNRWAQKAIVKMVGKMVGQPQPRSHKDLIAEYEASWYRTEKQQLAMPCRIVKACIVNGSITTNKVTTAADLKRSLRVLGYMSPIHTKGDMMMDCRITNNDSGVADMRARAVIPAGYHFDVVLQFGTVLSPDQVMCATEGAGVAIGLCDWRPQKGGDFGTYEVSLLPNTEEEINRILKDCSIPEETYVIPPPFLHVLQTGAASTASDPTNKAIAVLKHMDGEAKRRKNGSATPASDAE